MSSGGSSNLIQSFMSQMQQGQQPQASAQQAPFSSFLDQAPPPLALPSRQIDQRRHLSAATLPPGLNPLLATGRPDIAANFERAPIPAIQLPRRFDGPGRPPDAAPPNRIPNPRIRGRLFR